MRTLSRLTALRGLAAIMVMVSHFSNATNAFGKLFGSGGGQVGLMLFFILSGFLMASLYIHKVPDRQTLFSFAVARTARVAPLFAVVVLVSYVCTAWLGLSGFLNMHSFAYVAAHFALVKGSQTLWTIPVEVHFYMLFVVIWFFSHRSPLVWAVVACAMLGLMIAEVGYVDLRLAGYDFQIKILKHLAFFLTGTIIGTAYEKLRPLLRYKNNKFLVLLLLVFLAYPLIGEKLGLHLEMWSDARVLLLMSFVFCVVLFVLDDNCRPLVNRATCYLGDVSFGLYLLHFPLLHYAVQLDLPLWAQFCTFFFVTLLLASVSYHFIEHPGRLYIRRFSSRQA